MTNIIQMILFQKEFIKSLLEMDGLTLNGILLAVIFSLGYWIIRLDNRVETLNAYIKKDHKETLQILSELTKNISDETNARKEIKTVATDTNSTVKNTNSTVSNIHRMILDKLLNMK